MAHLYKSRLQTYAQKRNISFPKYACEMQGPPHARLFKSRVTVDGVTYEGPEFCRTLKDAEHAAAKVAFLSLSPDGSGTQEADDCSYKSLLQELAKKKGQGLALPVYRTNRTGPLHGPSFASTVEIAGECFVGQEAPTKKQAEMNAAKVAYTALTEASGGPRPNKAAVFSGIQMVGTSSFRSSSSQTVATDVKEHNLISATNRMQIAINDQSSYSIAKEAGKGKGEDIEKDTMTLPPFVIHQSQPKAPSNVVNIAKPNIRQENLVTQAGQVREGSSSNGKRNQRKQSSANPVMGSGAAKPPSTNIVIQPHRPGMTYEVPIQISDDEWVAMKANVHDEN